LGRSHTKEEIVCDADEDAINGDPKESPVAVRRASEVVDDDPKILLAHEHLDNSHTPTLHAPAGNARDMAPPGDRPCEQKNKSLRATPLRDEYGQLLFSTARLEFGRGRLLFSI
jgi:hypothetical protein